MSDSKPISVNRRRPPKKAKWNRKRLAVALPILVCFLFVLFYGIFSVIGSLFSPDARTVQTISEQPEVVVAAKQVKPPATTTTTEAYYEQYTVKSGDTLYGIALKFGISLEKMRAANTNVAKNSSLAIGMNLKIPVPKPPETKKEETETVTANRIPNIQVSREEIERGPLTNKRIALTFDAGATSEDAQQLIDTLKEKGVKATFFLTGKWIEENPGLTKSIAENGNSFGNHTYSHPDLTQEKEVDIRYQLASTERLIKETTGGTSKPIFRPPYGARDARVLRIAADEGYRSIYWTVDSLDWKTDITPEQVKNRVLAGLENGAIVLMHCGSSQTAQILPELIDDIKSRGYTIVDIVGLYE
jgi:peptidoglycan/xylan/chitin deacetylase (PgdA/CDA1 family)